MKKITYILKVLFWPAEAVALELVANELKQFINEHQ